MTTETTIPTIYLITFRDPSQHLRAASLDDPGDEERTAFLAFRCPSAEACHSRSQEFAEAWQEAKRILREQVDSPDGTAFGLAVIRWSGFIEYPSREYIRRTGGEWVESFESSPAPIVVPPGHRTVEVSPTSTEIAAKYTAEASDKVPDLGTVAVVVGSDDRYKSWYTHFVVVSSPTPLPSAVGGEVRRRFLPEDAECKELAITAPTGAVIQRAQNSSRIGGERLWLEQGPVRLRTAEQVGANAGAGPWRAEFVVPPGLHVAVLRPDGTELTRVEP